MKIYDYLSESMIIYQNLWLSIRIYDYLSESLTIYDNP